MGSRKLKRQGRAPRSGAGGGPVRRNPDRRDAKTPQTKTKADKTINSKADKAINNLLQGFLDRLAAVRIHDPACGSGNFLYVAIQQLLNLEKEVINFGARGDIGLPLFPTVRPTQLHGIEINPYAAELAQVVIWIGYLQWMRDNGFNVPRDPILQPLQSIECRDAILDLSDPANPKPAQWPQADFIIGNPPFLGSKLFRASGLADDYIQAMYRAYNLPKSSDLCCYWFERARQCIESSTGSGTGISRSTGILPVSRTGILPVQCPAETTTGETPVGSRARMALRLMGKMPMLRPQTSPNIRVGLLATQGIRGGDNREVLKRIKQTGDIFMAWSDRDWILDGAAVHVSIVGFDAGIQKDRVLDGSPTETVNANLSSHADTTQAKRLPENECIGWSIGTQKGGPFEFDYLKARQMLTQPNPTGRSNSNVVKPWRNASDVTGRLRGLWIVDFGPDMEESVGASYEAPFEFVRRLVKPERDSNRRDSYRLRWWIHQEARGELRPVLETPTVLLTPRVSKHRLWVRTESTILPDCAVVVFARSDDYFFGVLHSSVHELWALRMGTQLEDRPRYTPTTCFETFPLPWPPGKEPADGPLCRRIAAAAKELDAMRERWLNPPEWIEPIAAAVDAADDFADVPAEARGLIRQSAIMAAAAKDANLKKRTLTNLYNQRPTWLKLAHAELDRSVLAAYAAQDAGGGWREDWAEAWLDTGAGQPLPADHPQAARRAEIDQQVLANLLRLNQARQG